MDTQLAEMRKNTDADADVTLNCQGEVLMAHSLILGMRYIQHLKPWSLNQLMSAWFASFKASWN